MEALFAKLIGAIVVGVMTAVAAMIATKKAAKADVDEKQAVADQPVTDDEWKAKAEKGDL